MTDPSSPSWSDPTGAQPAQPPSPPPAPLPPPVPSEPPTWQQPAQPAAPSEPPTTVAPYSQTDFQTGYAPPTYAQPGYAPATYAQTGYGQTAYGQPGYPVYAQVPPTNGLAIASMIVSILGFGPVGAIMGHVARRQIQERGEQGDGFALAGIIVGWVTTGFWVLCCGGYALAIAGAFGTAGLSSL